MPCRGLVAAVAVLATGCAGVGLLTPPAPHDRYAAQLRQAGLDTTGLGRDWIDAAARALEQPVSVATPFRETGYLPATDAAAVAYRFDLRRGRRLVVEVRFETSAPARLFADLFWVSPAGSPQRVAALPDDSGELSHEVERDGAYILRLQPELLRGGRFTVLQRTLATLRFPVAEQTARAVQSGFGDLRDAGAREHEGIDIFARRGTAVLAVAGGVARNDVNELGGNVVWLADAAGRRRFYYAHLDRWAGEGTRRVQPGDILGYVGNTGNARHAPPHLHFGIYERGAIDPLPFLAMDDPVPAPTTAPDYLGGFVRVTSAREPLRTGPGTTFPAKTTVERYTLASVLGVSETWVRVALPDGSHGYLAQRSIGPTLKPIRSARLPAEAALRERPLAEAPVIQVLAAGDHLDVVAVFNEFDYARTAGGALGWVRRAIR